jgi:DeoR family fructose operon transcriptional repressor
MKTAETAQHRDLAPTRHERLKDLVRQHGVVRVDELCELLGVSPATIRRDLEALEETGLLRRVHGGAVSLETRLDEPLFDDKTGIATYEKRAIAEKAAELVPPESTIYIDGGSTLLELARILRERTNLTVVTNSLRAAVELSGMGPKVVLVGGELRRRSQTMVGPLTRRLLENMHVDIAFMGTIGLNLEDGMTTTDDHEAFTKELAIRGAKRVVLLAHSAKAGQASFARAGSLEDIDTFITDEGIDPQFIASLIEKDINVIIT